MKILGIDPGLLTTGWGVIEAKGTELNYIASGILRFNPKDNIEIRLAALYAGLFNVIKEFKPYECSLEKIFVNDNKTTSLKLGFARGALLACIGSFGLKVEEYVPNTIKKAVTGSGHASKEQIAKMVKMLFPKFRGEIFDEIDAMAIALCHVYNYNYKNKVINK